MRISFSGTLIVIIFTVCGTIPSTIPISDVEDEETGVNGVAAELDEGDYCLANWQRTMYKARILFKSDKYLKASKPTEM